MELYGSIQSISGSMTASVFTGSFVGDGSGLYGISASGVTGLNLSQISTGSVTASVSPSGFNVNANTTITGTLKVSGTIVAEQIDVTIYSSSVLYQSGSTRFGDSLDDIHNITGSVNITGSISLNGQAIGTGKLDESVFYSYTASNDPRVTSLEGTTASLNSFSNSINSYTSSNNNRVSALETASGSLNAFTSSINTTIKDKLNSDGVISGSIQVEITGTTGYSTFSSSIATTDLNQNNRLSAIETSTGSLNTFTGSINTLIKDKLNFENVVSSSSQILLTGTTGYSTFSSSIATTDSLQEGRLNSLETSTSSLNTFSSSASSRLTSIEGTTSSLNTFTSSANSRLNSLESASSSIRSDFNSYTSSNDSTNTTQNSRLTAIETSTGSLNTYTSSNNARLSAIETSTSSLNTFTGSINTTIKNRLNAENVISGSGQIDITQTTNYTTFSSSLATTDLNQSNKISTIESTTASLNTFTSSANGRLNSLETSSGSLNSFTSSASGRLNSIETSTSSLNTFTSSASGRLSAIETSTGSLNSFTSSANSKLSAIETSTSSLNSFTSSINTTIKNRLNAEGVISGSVQVTLSNTTGYSTFSSSLATTDAGQDSRLTALENKTGSYATTGSNIFIGDQTITGSLYISQDLIVGGSSSIQHISSSIVNIADNIITVNAQNPSVRFGGLAVIDSGSSPQVSGSMLFDSVNNQWLFVHQNQSTVTSSVLLMGPETFNNLGGETYLTQNRLVKGTGIEHLVDSNITDTGTKVSINSNTEVTGSIKSTSDITAATNLVSNFSSGDEGGEINLNKPVTNTTLNSGITIDVWRDRVRIFESGGTNRGGFFNIANLSASVGTNFLSTAETASFVEYSNVANKPTLVSGSSQINHNATTNYDANQHIDHTAVSITAGNGLSGGGTIASTRTIALDTGSAHFLDGVKKELNTEGVISGSSQVSFLSISDRPSGLVSGSSQITYSAISGIPSGIVSGSIQVDLTGTTNYVSGVKTRLNAEGVLSGSAQVVSALPAGTVSGSSQVLNGTTIHSGSFFNGITVVSGSGQISFNGITDKPALVSGSSQITYSGLSGIPSGIVSGSSQISFGSISGVPSGLVSGSSQITFSSISGIPSGLVSGSSQISFGSISGVPSGLVSGSSQISFGSISGVPSGLVSGSSQITGINNNQLTNSSFHVGTTSISLGRASASQTLTGVSIDGNAATATNSTQLNGISETQIFNNMGANHGARTSFDASTPSYGFGFRYVQGNTNGPATGGGSQFYSWYLGLGNEYPATGTGSYGMYVAIPRTATTPYMSVRYNENNSLGSWIKIAAGYADTAGSANSVAGANVSGNISGNASNITAYSINQNLATSSSPTFSQMFSTLNTSSGRANLGFNVAKTVLGNLHIQNGAGPGTDNGNQAALTFQGGSSSEAQAGIYVLNNNSYGTSMGFATTDSYSTGPQLFMTATNSGVVNFPRANPTSQGNAILHAGNYTSYTLPRGGSWYGVNTPGSRWGGFSTSGGEIVFGDGLPNAGQMGILIDGAYLAGENNGFWSLPSNNDWNGRVGFYRDGSGNAAFNASVIPTANNTYNLGTASLGWANVYTNDLHLSNMNKEGGNDIDGTNGNWTIQEGAENLYIINNNNGKKYRIKLEEI